MSPKFIRIHKRANSMHKLFLSVVFLGLTATVSGQDAKSSKSDYSELDWIKDSVGVWDAAAEVWPNGPDKPSIQFKSVETNTAHGTNWISSDLDTEFNGQKMNVHSIVGFDPGKKKLVGFIVDDGPYPATLTGTFDAKKRSVQWITKGNQPDGTPLVQRTTLTNKDSKTRILILKVPGKEKGEFITTMKMTFIKRD